jgi:hypothetical protein
MAKWLITNKGGRKMKKGQKSMLVLWIVTVFITFGLFIPGVVGAGYLEPPTEAVDEDGDPVSTMRTLEEVYNKTNLLKNKLNQLLCIEGDGAWITSYRDFDEDGYGDPIDTVEECSQPVGYVLDNTDCDDADSGINPGAEEDFGNDIDENCDGNDFRFTDLGDGTVRDNKTGLIWLKNANCFGMLRWAYNAGYPARREVAALAEGLCELTDGSEPGDWRLPTKAEWEAFVDKRFLQAWPLALSNAAGDDQWSQGDAFNNVQSDYYWSDTQDAHIAWSVWMESGGMGTDFVTTPLYVWPVK